MTISVMAQWNSSEEAFYLSVRALVGKGWKTNTNQSYLRIFYQPLQKNFLSLIKIFHSIVKILTPPDKNLTNKGAVHL